MALLTQKQNEISVGRKKYAGSIARKDNRGGAEENPGEKKTEEEAVFAVMEGIRLGEMELSPALPVLQCVAVSCSVLKCVAVCCSVLRCVAVWCSALQCVAVWCVRCSELQCVAVRCSVLQCVAVCCSVCCSVLRMR